MFDLDDLPKPWGTPPSQLWRDIKTYKDHVFIVADGAGDHGMQVFDLHMIDIRDPKNPTFVGCSRGESETHDSQCVVYQGPDVRYQGHELCLNSNGPHFEITDEDGRFLVRLWVDITVTVRPPAACSLVSLCSAVSGMERKGLPRHVIWLALGVILPGGMLLLFGFLLIRQESELASRRDADALTLEARALADRMEGYLEGSVVAPSGDLKRPKDGGALYLGYLAGGAFQAAAPPDDQAMADPEFGVFLTRASQREFRDGNPAAAFRLYERRLSTESDSTRRAYLQMLLAANAFRRGDAETATGFAQAALSTPRQRTDEDGLPIALFAAELIFDYSEANVCGALEAVAHDKRWMTVSAFSYWLELSTDGQCVVDSLVVAEYELARWVQAQGPALAVSGDRTVSAWRPVPGGWLLRYGTGSDPQPILARRVTELPVFGAESVGLGTALEPSDRDLGPLFPSLVAGFPTGAGGLWKKSALLGLALLLVLAMTAFGTFLLWRDVQRETRVSSLKSQFVSSVSHEVRTPLTSIRLFAEAMLEYGPGGEEEQKKSLEVIAYESGRLTRMLNNVLETSRIERGAVNYTLQPGDLSEAVRSAADALDFAFRRREVALTQDIASVLASFDSDAIEQAVVNLLSNALKYGGGTTVGLSCAEADGEAVISVTDSGPGIPLEEQAHIFERFVQGERRASGSSSGVGLGLSLVKHIVEGHGGRIELDSEQDTGSRFTIRLALST
ncbi:MAG: signal transduction histidine kinase [Rhodothermales bacterium]